MNKSPKGYLFGIQNTKELLSHSTKKEVAVVTISSLKKIPNDQKSQKTKPKTKKMRPYKKRSFYSQLQSNENGMETENSDDSEKQSSPPPTVDDSETKKDKDKEGEVKNRKKWKRKISRKQFRHHDIKLFTPGEYRTSTFLKHKDSNLTHQKKLDATIKESITESIVTSLGGQKLLFAKKLSQKEETVDKNKNDIEENNNTINNMHNYNIAGKHQLPAIVMETPSTKKRSLETIHMTKTSFPKNVEKKSSKKILQIRPKRKATSEDNSVNSSKCDTLSEDSSEDTVMDTNSRSYADHVDSITETRLQDVPVSEASRNTELEVSKGSNAYEGRSVQNHLSVSNDHSENMPVKNLVQQTAQPMERQYRDEPENLSLKRRHSPETPIDLSKKASSTQNMQTRPTSNFEQTEINPVTSNTITGYIPRSSSKCPSTVTSFQTPVSEANIPSTTTSLNPPSSGNIDRSEANSLQLQRSGSSPEKNYNEEFERILKSSWQKLSSDITKIPPAYLKNYLSKVQQQNLSQNSFTNSLITMTSLNMWSEVLQDLLRRQFNTQLLNDMSHAYQQLNTIKDEPHVPSEIKENIQKVLAETYSFISGKLKQFGLDINPSTVIQILGQSEANVQKNTLQNSLESIQRIRHLNINDYPPKIPTSVNQHMSLENKQIKIFEPLNPPTSTHMNKFIQPSFRASNKEFPFPKTSHIANDQFNQRRQPNALVPTSQPLPLEQSVSLGQRSMHPMNNMNHPPQLIPPVGNRFGYGSSVVPMSFPRDVQVPPANPFVNNLVHDINNMPYPRSNISLTRPRSKSHRPRGSMGGRHTLKRSFSNPQNNPSENNLPLGYPYMNSNRAVSNNASSAYFHSPEAGPQNVTRNGNIFIPLPNMSQKLVSPIAPPSYSEAIQHVTQSQVPKEADKYRHSFPEYTKNVPPPLLPKKLDMSFNESRMPPMNDSVNFKMPEHRNSITPKKHTTPAKIHSTEENITSTTDHLEVSRIASIPRQANFEDKSLAESKPKQKENLVPAVIVADTSMQITKEPTVPPKERVIREDLQEKSTRISVITSSNQNTAKLEETLKKPIEKDQDENNSEFLVWLEKLKSNEKLKSKFLSQMGIVKKEEMISSPPEDFIEIMDSDEETSDEPVTDKTKVSSPVSDPPPKDSHKPISQEPTKINSPTSAKEKLTASEHFRTIAVPRSLEITPIISSVSEASRLMKNQSPKESLSKTECIPPITLPYIPNSAASEEERNSKEKVTKKAIYSPEIEPISPVGNEQNFTFPEVSAAAKILPPPLPINVREGIVLRDRISSPSHIHKRKTPVGGTDYQSIANDKSVQSNREPSEYADSVSKRRKSLDRPQIPVSPRIAPSGKLCYVRQNHIFLRYYDDTQMELFIKSLSTQDEELLRTTGIDHERIKNACKHSNFGLDQLGKTEIIFLPRDIEFSRKEDLPDVEEFVKESNLVEKYVPKDFADFYRYVTGFQIIKNKDPVSLQTFLTMYNTNRTTELLRKYLQRLDEDASGAMVR